MKMEKPVVEDCRICETVPAARRDHPNHPVFVVENQKEAEALAKDRMTLPGTTIFIRNADETHYRGTVVQTIPVGTVLDTQLGAPYITWVKTDLSKE